MSAVYWILIALALVWLGMGVAVAFGLYPDKQLGVSPVDDEAIR